MNAPTDIQIIRQGGKPAFVVIPYDEYMRLYAMEHGLVPQAVVDLAFDNDWTLLKAWRKHLGLSQREVAERASMSQAAYSQIESGKHKTQERTLRKIADAMGVSVEQLCMDE